MYVPLFHDTTVYNQSLLTLWKYLYIGEIEILLACLGDVKYCMFLGTTWLTAKKGVHQFRFFLSSMRTPDYLVNHYKILQIYGDNAKWSGQTTFYATKYNSPKVDLTYSKPDTLP